MVSTTSTKELRCESNIWILCCRSSRRQEPLLFQWIIKMTKMVKLKYALSKVSLSRELLLSTKRQWNAWEGRSFLDMAWWMKINGKSKLELKNCWSTLLDQYTTPKSANVQAEGLQRQHKSALRAQYSDHQE